MDEQNGVGVLKMSSFKLLDNSWFLVKSFLNHINRRFGSKRSNSLCGKQQYQLISNKEITKKINDVSIASKLLG